MASIDPYAVGADSISARARLPYPQTRPVYNPLHACTYCAHGGVFMSYLDCASMTAAITRRAAAAWTYQRPPYRPRGRCLRQLPQQRGLRQRRYRQPAGLARDRDPLRRQGCRHLEGRCCCADHVSLTSAAAAPNAPPAPRGRPPNNFIPERMPFSQSGIPFLLLNHPLLLYNKTI